MTRTPRLQSVVDRVRQAMYATALVVGVGSLWTVAWADALAAKVPIVDRRVDPPPAYAAVAPDERQVADGRP